MTQSARSWRTTFAYRLTVTSRFTLALALLVVAVVGTIAVVRGGTSATSTTLRLDGVPFRPELALTSARRPVGLMNRRPAPADGMLFVFPTDTRGGFWMKNTLVPLTIAFFDAQGKRVRKLSMTPCRSDPCALYKPKTWYRFALELRASDTRPAAKLGPVAELRRLSRLAS